MSPQASSSATSEQLPALPTPPSGPMDVEAAYAFLGMPPDERGSLEKLKARFRKLCIAYHPDKNLGREKEAAAAFTGLHAAYHFLTTTNFDHARWAASFVIPPLQSLEEVLALALRGADPAKLEELLRRRGEYRPHAEFGINLSIPCAAHLGTSGPGTPGPREPASAE